MMKFKNLVVLAIIVTVCVVGYHVINEDGNNSISSSRLEQQLIATLPPEETECYCVKSDGEKVLNRMEVKKLTIDRQTTHENLKTADCTVELEGEDIKLTKYLSLSCIKYDDGTWQVESSQERFEPEITPKYRPDESDFFWNIQRYEELYLLNKVSEYGSMEEGTITYFFSVHDEGFTGNGASCTATFQDTGWHNDDRDIYWWLLSNEVN